MKSNLRISTKGIVICIWTIITICQVVKGQDSFQQNEIDSLKYLLKNTNEDSVLARTLYHLGDTYRRINSDTSIYWIEKLISFGKEKSNSKYITKGYTLKANVYRYNRKFDEAKKSYRDALNEFLRIKQYDGILLANCCLMKCFISEFGNKDSIQYYFEQSILLKDSLTNNFRYIADTYADYSDFLIDKGDYYSAMTNLKKAIDIYDEVKMTNRIYFAQNRLAEIHLHLNNLREAKAILEDIQPKVLELKGYPLYSFILLNLGRIYQHETYYNQAHNFLHKAAWINKVYKTLENEDVLYTAFARLKLTINQLDSAIFYANKTLKVKGVLAGYAHVVNLELGKIYTKKRDFDRAMSYIQGFIAYQKEKNKKAYLPDAYLALCNIYEQKGDYKKAYKYHHVFSTYKDSIYTEENGNKIADLEAKYWSAQKRNELALVRKSEELKTREVQQALIQNKLFASQRNGLIIGIVLVIVFSVLLYRINLQRRKNKLMQQVTALELKAIRAQMNPHFMFNALSVIQMLINKNDVRQANTALAKFGKLMRLILENSEKQTVSIGEEIETLKLYIELESLRFPFNHNLNIDPKLDVENMEIPSMIIQPYIENAIKHGVSTRLTHGNVNINFRRMENQLLCTVEDDGIGREMAEATKSKYAKHKSMGSKLSKDRLTLIGKQIAGKAEVEIEDLYSDKGMPIGTLVKLNIPITYHEN